MKVVKIILVLLSLCFIILWRGCSITNNNRIISKFNNEFSLSKDNLDRLINVVSKSVESNTLVYFHNKSKKVIAEDLNISAIKKIDQIAQSEIKQILSRKNYYVYKYDKDVLVKLNEKTNFYASISFLYYEEIEVLKKKYINYSIVDNATSDKLNEKWIYIIDSNWAICVGEAKPLSLTERILINTLIVLIVCIIVIVSRKIAIKIIQQLK